MRWKVFKLRLTITRPHRIYSIDAIDGLKGEWGHAPFPELGPQQVPAEAIWRLENASEPFSDLDFAPRGPRWGTLQHSPDLPAGGEGTGCLPTNPLPLSRPFVPQASVPSPSPLTRNMTGWIRR